MINILRRRANLPVSEIYKNATRSASMSASISPTSSSSSPISQHHSVLALSSSASSILSSSSTPYSTASTAAAEFPPGFEAPPAELATLLPPAPQGFQWTYISDIGAAVLRPHGWYLKFKVSGSGFYQYYMSEEPTPYQTGLSFGVFKTRDNSNPEAALDLWIETCKRRFFEETQPGFRSELLDEGKFLDHEIFFTAFIQRRRVSLAGAAKSDSQNQIVRSFLFINRKTGTSYSGVFEYPEKQSSSAESIGAEIFENLAFHPGL